MLNRTSHVSPTWIRPLIRSLLCIGAGFILAHSEIRDLYLIAVALAGMLLPMNWAVMCAVMIPVLHTIAFGSPALTEELPLVVCQTIALAAFANFFYGMVGLEAFLSLAAALGLSLVVLACGVSIFGAVSNLGLRMVPYLVEEIKTGWVGMLLMLFAVPPVVDALRMRRV